MKALVKEITYKSTRDGKHGKLHSFNMRVITPEGDEVGGFYTTNDSAFNTAEKTSKKFKEGQEYDIVIHENTSDKGKKWNKITPEPQAKGAKYNQSLRREQSKYSGFSASYIKDMMVAGLLMVEQADGDGNLTKEQIAAHNDEVMHTWRKRSHEIFEHMVKIDKTIEE